MNRKGVRKTMGIAAGILLLASLTACQGGSGSVAESCWKKAKKADSLEDYMAENEDKVDLEALKQEASSADGPISQQFKAVAMLCAAEYRKEAGPGTTGGDSKVFKVDYPETASYAESLLSRVNTGGEEFWNAMGEAFYPYDCLWLTVAAAENLDGQTLVNLLSGIPEEENYGSDFKEALDAWVKEKPESVALVGEALKESGYYKEWSEDDWKSTYFHLSTDPYQIATGTADEAMAYVSYLRDVMVPSLESEYGEDMLKSDSSLGESKYYNTKLMVGIGEELTLNEAAGGQGSAADGQEAAALEGQEGEAEGQEAEALEGEGAQEAEGGIPLEGKKVAAFYRNPKSGEFEGSAPPLQLIGDFMLELSPEEYPASLAEADYYLVLTADLEYGDNYQTYGGKDTGVQQVVSSTSVDLYEASTGNFLHHIGNVMETPPDQIFTSSDTKAMYPEVASADALHYIYQNMNQPSQIVALLDNLSGKSKLEIGEEIVLGNWSITYNSGVIVKEFDEGMYRYTADDGMQFARCYVSLTNKGFENDGFMPMVYQVGEDPVVSMVHANGEDSYECVDLLTYGKCLVGTYLDPGETKEGELFFQIPEDVAAQPGDLQVKVSLGNQAVYYPFVSE